MNKKEIKKLTSKKVRDPNIEGLAWPSKKRFKTMLMMSLGVLLLMLVVGIFNKDGLLEVVESENELNALKTNIARLENENQELKQEIFSINNNPKYLERIAREDLGLAQPNETIFVFSD